MILLLVFSFCSACLFSQETINVSGVIRDEAGEPIPGANVVIKGTMNGTITNINGEYTVAIPKETETFILVFTFIGYKTKEMEFTRDNENKNKYVIKKLR